MSNVRVLSKYDRKILTVLHDAERAGGDDGFQGTMSSRLKSLLRLLSRRRDQGRHTGDLDKGSCTPDRKASLKSPCDSRRAEAAGVGFSLLHLDVRPARGGSGPFQGSVPKSQATTPRQSFRCTLSSSLKLDTQPQESDGGCQGAVE